MKESTHSNSYPISAFCVVITAYVKDKRVKGKEEDPALLFYHLICFAWSSFRGEFNMVCGTVAPMGCKLSELLGGDR